MQAIGLLIAVALLISLLYVLWRPHWAFLLIILMYPLEQLLQSYLPTLITFGKAVNWAIGIVCLAAATMAIIRGQPVIRPAFNLASLSTIGLYIIVLAGLTWTPAPDYANETIRGNFQYWGLLLVVAPLLLRDLEMFRRILTPLLALGTLVAVLIIINPKSSYYGGRLMLDLGMLDSGGANPLALARLGGLMALVAALMRPARAS